MQLSDADSPTSIRPQGLVDVRRDGGATAVLLSLCAIVPILDRDPASLGILAVMLQWMGINIAWNLVLGYAGMLSFGQVAFFAVGAYAAAILNVHLAFPGWLDTIGASFCGALAALLIGGLTIRLRGIYVALATLAFHELLNSLVSTDYSGLTGGPNGLTVPHYIAAPDLVAQAVMGYVISLVGVTVVAFLVLALLRSPIGLAVVASRDAELVASARGVQPTSYRMIVFGFSGAVCGLIGGIYAHYVGVVSPTLFSFGLVMQLLSMIIVGGWGTYWGPIIGTATMTFVTSNVQDLFPQYQSIIVASIMLMMILLFRDGIAGIAYSYSARWSRRSERR